LETFVPPEPASAPAPADPAPAACAPSPRGTRATNSSVPSTIADTEPAHQMLSGLAAQMNPPTSAAVPPASEPNSRAWPYS
jgi:hypothetical protein